MQKSKLYQRAERNKTASEIDKKKKKTLSKLLFVDRSGAGLK